MAKLYMVRIDEVEGSDLRSIGKKQPLRSLEEVFNFLVEYTTAWKQSPPPPIEAIEAQFEAQRAALFAQEGPALPGSRKCVFTLCPYANSDIAHVITVMEVSGTLSTIGQSMAVAIDVPVGRLTQRSCRVCGCTEDDCRQCVDHTGEPCHWVSPDLCSACTPQETPMTQTQWVLSFAQTQVMPAVIAAWNHWDHRRHDERFQFRVVHHNERDHFVYLTVAKGELVSDDALVELGWRAHEMAQKGGPADG